MRRLTRVHIYINIYIFALFLLQRLPPPSLSFKYSFQRNIQPCTCICICNGVQILYWNNVQTTDHIIIHHSQCCQLDMNNQAHLLLFQISQYRPCVFEGTYLLHVFNTVFLHVIVSCTLPQDTWTWSRTCNQKHHTAVQCLCAVYACVCVCMCLWACICVSESWTVSIKEKNLLSLTYPCVVRMSCKVYHSAWQTITISNKQNNARSKQMKRILSKDVSEKSARMAWMMGKENLPSVRSSQ